MSLQKFQKFQKFEVLTIRAQPAVGQASFGEPSLMKCVDDFRQCCLHFRRPHQKARPRSQGSTCSRLICAKMAATMASMMGAVPIDPSGLFPFSNEKWVRNKSCLFVTVWSQQQPVHSDSSGQERVKESPKKAEGQRGQVVPIQLWRP